MPYDLETLFTEMTERFYPEIATYGIDLYSLLKAHAKRESDFNPAAITPETGGEYSIGLMQVEIGRARILDPVLKSKTDAEVKNALLDARYNLYLGAMYIVQQIKRYDGKLTFAVSAYNAGSVQFLIDGKVIYWDPDGFFQVANNIRVPVDGYDESLLDTYQIKNIGYVNFVINAYNEYLSGTAGTEKKNLTITAAEIGGGVVLGGLVIWLLKKFKG